MCGNAKNQLAQLEKRIDDANAKNVKTAVEEIFKCWRTTAVSYTDVTTSKMWI